MSTIWLKMALQTILKVHLNFVVSRRVKYMYISQKQYSYSYLAENDVDKVNLFNKLLFSSK